MTTEERRALLDRAITAYGALLFRHKWTWPSRRWQS